MLRTRGTHRATAVRRLLCWRAQSTHTGTGPRDQHAPPAKESTPTAETHVASHAPPGQSRERDSLTTSAIDVDALRSWLREFGALASTSLRQRADHFSNKATTAFSHLGLRLNRMTGYEEIEALKRRVVEQEARIEAARRAAREAKAAHDDAVCQRSVSQREVNDLLQRKSGWTDTDVSNFTSLVRSDHSYEQEESRAKTRVAETEDAVEREFSELMRIILARYHEEQVWSDKIRSASTYGSLAVLGVNLVVFIMAIIVVEPWKRKRLAQTFEKKVEELGAETRTLLDANAARLEERLTEHQKLLTGLVTQMSSESHQGPFGAQSALGPSPEETPMVPPPSPSWWSREYLSYQYLGVVRGRELALVAGSAAASGVITLLTHALFAK